MATFWNKRTATITGVAITLLGAYYVHQSPKSITYTMSNTNSSNSVLGLDFKLTQSSRNPPVLLVTLRNNADTPYTLLTWGTPLDSAALNTGIFKITNAETGAQVEQTILQINRKMPPPQEELVTIAPGTEEEIQIVFDKPWMPEQKPAKYKVKAQGDFKGLWDEHPGNLTDDDLNAYSESPFSGKKFLTNEVVMEIHEKQQCT